MNGTERLSPNNQVELVGTIISEELKFSHEVLGEKFYQFQLSTKRLSGVTDTVLVIVSENSEEFKELRKGLRIYITGQYRSYNKYEDGKNHLILSVFPEQITLLDEEEFEDNDIDKITLQGFICKKPTYRQTPLGKKISDVIIGVNRLYGKSAYIPIIVWGEDARWISYLGVGREIKILGRIQSRKYLKKISKEEYEKLSKLTNPENLETIETDGNVEYFKKGTAYEVSASKIELIN